MASSVKYHKTYLKLHSEYEEYAYPLIKKALDEQTKAITDFIDEDNFDNLDIYIQFLVDQKPLYNALEKIYTKVGVSSATFSYDWIRNSVPKSRKDFILDFFNPEWYREMVEYFRLIGGNKVTGIDETTIDKIKNVLANILGQNLSRRDQAKLFEQTLNDPAFNRARSLVIARTESTTAANYGINMGAESSDYEVQKFWINTKDKRTRRSHLLMTKDPIAINQPFVVGGVNMMYPGDPLGTPQNLLAAEVVNCRCVMATEAILDSDGLPILKPRTPPYLRQSAQLPKLPNPISQLPVQTSPQLQTGFKDAVTIKDAKQQSINIINDNTSININKLDVSDDLELQQLNNLNRQLYKLVNTYNLTPNYSKLKDTTLLFKSTSRTYGYVENSYGGDILTINFGSKHPSIDARTKGRVYQNDYGYYSYAPKSQVDKDNVRISTLTHEFAHLISVKNDRLIAQYPLLNDYWKEIASLKRKYQTEINKYGRVRDFNSLKDVYLGDYASTNINEFVAEGFTEYQLNSNPSKYALEIGKIIDKYFKKK